MSTPPTRASTSHESSKWFVGLKSRPDAERALQLAPVGAFLVRTPLVPHEGDDGLPVAFVLSHKLATGHVAHTRIVRDPASHLLTFQHETVASSKAHYHLCDLLATHRLNLKAGEAAAKELHDGLDRSAVRTLNVLLPGQRVVKSTRAALAISIDVARAAVDLYRGHIDELHEDQDAGLLLYETDAYALLQKYALELRAVDLDSLAPTQRACFFLNVYTALLLHGVILLPLDTGRNAAKSRVEFAKHVAYDVGGHTLSLYDIEFGILRGPNSQPKKSGLFSRAKPPPRSQYALDATASTASAAYFLIPTLTDAGPPLASFADNAQCHQVAGEYLQRVLKPDEPRRAVLVPDELALPLAEFGLGDFLKRAAAVLTGPLRSSLTSLSDLNSKIDDMAIEWPLKIRISASFGGTPVVKKDNLSVSGEQAEDAPPLPAGPQDTGGVPPSAGGLSHSGTIRIFNRKKGAAGAAGASGAGNSAGGAGGGGGGSGGGGGGHHANGAGEEEMPADSVATDTLTGRAQNVLGKASTEKPHLIMKHMQLTGVPADVLQMTHVEVLDLRSNQIDTLPDLIGKLVSLRTLRIANNHCSELPHTMTQLKNLTELDLGQNEFGKFGLSPDIALLTTLRNLLLQWNNLERLPDSIGTMLNLRWLDASVNRMGELPVSMTGLRLLEQLDLSHNMLAELPASLLALTALVRLELIGNDLESLPAAIAMLNTLTRLDLRINRLAQLPKTFAQLTGLRALLLERNQLKKLPAEVAHLASVREALLSCNQLTKLPPFGAGNTALEELHAYKNELKELPDELGDCPTLRQLDVSDNHLSALPAALGRNKGLHRLVVARNKLKAFPDELGHCSGLQELFAFHNDIKALPKSFKELDRLQFLQLNGNRISKLDEKVLLGMKALQSLQLAGNRLKTLPSLSERLTALTDLNLHCNALADLPDAFAMLDALKTLNLGRNHLHEAKNWKVLAALTSLTALSIDDNALTAVPDAVCALRTLTHLAVSCNRIAKLPSAVTALGSLTSLFLNNNRLAALPDPMPSEAAIKEANFAFNRITTLPQSLVNCTALTDLDLSGNRLTESPDLIIRLMPACDIKTLGNAFDDLPRPPQPPHVKLGGPRVSSSASGSEIGSGPVVKAKPGARFRASLATTSSVASSDESESVTLKDEITVRFVLGDSMPRRGCNVTVHAKLSLDEALATTNTSFGIPDGKKRGHLLVRNKQSQVYVANMRDAELSLHHALSLINMQLFEVVLADDAAAAKVVAPAPPTSAPPAAGSDAAAAAAAAAAAVAAAPAAPIDPEDAEVLARLAEDAAGLSDNLSAVYAKRALLNSSLAIGWAEMQGRRPEQQDRLQVMRQLTGESSDELYVGIFDGHTGHETSTLCAAKLHLYLAEAIEQSREDKGLKLKSDGPNGHHTHAADAQFTKAELKSNRRVTAALRHAFERVHHDTERLELPDGASVIVALVLGRRVFLASAGDCRAVVFDVESHEVVWTTVDHKPDTPSEIARIKQSGGFVSDKCRVNGVLSLSRAIGDVALQPAVSWEPDISIVPLRADRAYRVVMACDGLYDVCGTNDELPAAMGSLHIGTQDLLHGAWYAACAASRLREFAYAHDSRDNLSVVIVDVKAVVKSTV